MKKILSIVFLSVFIFLGISYASETDRYPFIVTTDRVNFTTSVGKFWRWMEMRVHFVSNTTANIWCIIDSGDGANYDTIIKKSVIVATTDVVIYPGATSDTAEVLLRSNDEFKVVISGTSVQGYVSIVGEEI